MIKCRFQHPLTILRYLPWLVCSVFLLSSCATTNKTKTVIAMIASGIVAGTIDANLSDHGGSFNSHSTAVGLGVASLVGVGSMYYFDDEKKRIESDRKLEVAQQEIRALHGEEELNSNATASSLEKDLPSEYRSLVKPGKWEIYHLNNWVSQTDGTFIHQDKMIRITNPTFQPNKNNEGVSNE